MTSAPTARRRRFTAAALVFIGAAAVAAHAAGTGTTATESPGASADVRAVAELDRRYQRAVQDNDVKTMSTILAADFVLVEGTGKVWSKTDILDLARNGKTHYLQQDDTQRRVRVWGDTAVVTAKLHARGIEDGEQVDYEEWFSDTYVRIRGRWWYVFGQASLPLPAATH